MACSRPCNVLATVINLQNTPDFASSQCQQQHVTVRECWAAQHCSPRHINRLGQCIAGRTLTQSAKLSELYLKSLLSSFDLHVTAASVYYLLGARTNCSRISTFEDIRRGVREHVHTAQCIWSCSPAKTTLELYKLSSCTMIAVVASSRLSLILA